MVRSKYDTSIRMVSTVPGLVGSGVSMAPGTVWLGVSMAPELV